MKNDKLVKLWDIKKTQYKVSDFVTWQKTGGLELSPSFQRRPVWRPSAKSFLIDTILRGLPIPIIFVRERQTNIETYVPVREVVDGQQRIRTLLAYIAPKSLRDFNKTRDEFTIRRAHNRDLSGKGFKELSFDYQKRILDYEFSVHVLPTEVSDREVLQIFARMNATGVKLNEQELRNAEFDGELKTSVYDSALKNLTRWREWGIFTEDNIARMLEAELTSEFYLLMIKGSITGRSKAALNALYKQFDDEFAARKEVELRFNAVMDHIEDAYGEILPRSAFNKRTLFYILFAYFYDILYSIGADLKHKKSAKVLPRHVEALNLFSEQVATEKLPKSVAEALERRTTHLSSRKALIKYLQDLSHAR